MKFCAQKKVALAKKFSSMKIGFTNQRWKKKSSAKICAGNAFFALKIEK